MKKIYKFSIEPITAIHIGTGNELTPLDYFVTTKIGEMDFKRPVYVKYSWDKILDSIKKDNKKLNEFMSISNVNNMVELRNFFHKNVTLKSMEALCETTNEFLSLYHENKDPIQNAASVFEMQRNADKDAIIPGSSIKGAIRTAILNGEYLIQKDKKLVTSDIKTLESQLFGINRNDAKNDPFRCISISDCTLPFKKGTQFVTCVKNVHVNKKTEEIEEKASMQLLAEFIRGELTGQKTIAEGRIIIDENLFKINSSMTKKYSIKDIISMCNTFYMNEFNKEIDKFYANESDNTELITPLIDILDAAVATQNTFILRVGRWSQVEFVTIDGIRAPKTPKKKGGCSMPYGTSRFDLQYNGQFLPIGWCKCILEEIN